MLSEKDGSAFSELAALKRALEALETERGRLVKSLHKTTSEYEQNPHPNTVKKIRSEESEISKLSREIESIRNRIESLAELAGDRTTPEGWPPSEPGGPPPFASDPGSNWDDLVSSLGDDKKKHHSVLNRFVGGSQAALAGLTITFLNTHVHEIEHGQFAILAGIIVLTLTGLALSPMHSILGLWEVRAIERAASESYGQVHWARMVSFISGTIDNYGQWRVLLLWIQYEIWIAALILGGFFLQSIAPSSTV